MTVHQRAEWNAAPPKHPCNPLYQEPYVPVHHIGAGPAWPTDVASILHGIQSMEMAKSYVDFSYCVCTDYRGDEWIGRGYVQDGATLGYAGRSMSVLVVCNAAAPDFTMNQAQIDGVGRAIARAQAAGVVAPNAYIDGHHWFDAQVTKSPTACPSQIMEKIPAIRSAVHPGPTPPPPNPVPSAPGGEMTCYTDEVHPEAKPTEPGGCTVDPANNIILTRRRMSQPGKSEAPSVVIDGERIIASNMGDGWRARGSRARTTADGRCQGVQLWFYVPGDGLKTRDYDFDAP